MKQILSILISIIALTVSAARDEFSINYLGVERGLSNNHVVGITQDKHGFIWIATDEGLNRFDGHNFKIFLKDENPASQGLTGNELNAIMDDPTRSVIWIATQRAGLNAYDYSTGTFKSYTHDPGDPASIATDDVTALAPAADGGIWVATFSAGVDHLDPETGKFTHYSKDTVKDFPDASCWSVVETNDGFLYVVHEYDGFSVIDTERMTARNYRHIPGDPTSLPSSLMKCVYKDQHDNIWLGTGAGLVLYNPAEDTFTNFSEIHSGLRHTVSDIRQFSRGRLWVAMERGGVAVLDLTDSVFSNPEATTCTLLQRDFDNKTLSSPSIRCLYEDEFGNVWAGSWGGGVNLISSVTPAFRYYPHQTELSKSGANSANSVLTVSVDNDNTVWVGTDGGELRRYVNGNLEAVYSKHGGTLPGGIVQSSYKGADGSLWLGFFNEGACRFDTATGRYENVFPSGSRVDVRDIASDNEGNIIFGCTNGIWRYNVATRHLAGPYSVWNNLVRRIYPLETGDYLIGTFGSGLVHTDRDFNEKRRYDIESGFPSNTVNDIYLSRDGRLFVASGEGLVVFPDFEGNQDEFSVINRGSGLGNTHILSVTQDRSGAVWLSTNGGISCLKGDRILNYTHRDHVPIGNFLGHSVGSDKQGNLYFGAISGLCSFNPVKVLETVDNPEPVIVELLFHDATSKKSDRLDEIQLAGREKVRLQPGQNSFEIAFTSRNFALTGEVEYSYMLTGRDDNWIMARSGNIASFRNLTPGEYIFKVRTRIRNQEWGEPAELKILIPPPFYLSWWARTLYVLMALGVAMVLLYLYRKRLKAESRLKAEEERHQRESELNDERLRFYTNITHELRTPLTLITGPLEDLSRDSQLPEKERKSLEMVHRNAKRLLDLVNRLLEFRKTETQNRRLSVRRGNIAATVYEVALKYKELNRNRKVTLNVSTESGEMPVVYDKEIVTVILDNLISNSMKYTPQGEVKVDCRRKERYIVITVADTGVGIAPGAIDHIFERYYQEKGPHQAAGTGIGLALVKNVVALHHGTITVESEEGKGTEFVVRIPADEAYPEAMHIEEEPLAGDATRDDETTDDNAELAAADRKPLILLVEDNADIRDYVKQSFTDLYDVRCAENGKEGLEMAIEIMPSLIVSDIMMPVMDGVEMTRALKGDVRTSHIPVILLTAKEGESDRQEGYESGADSYLTKPFSSTLLQSRINNLLLQRIKLNELFSSRPASASAADDVESVATKREQLMKSLSEVDREFIATIDRTITDNIPAENVDVNFLAATLCMSTSTLYRKVKALTGLSPTEYIRKTKMQLAERYLLEGKFTFSEIAFKVGMTNAAYFRQCFKEEFGMTPSEYKHRLTCRKRE